MVVKNALMRVRVKRNRINHKVKKNVKNNKNNNNDLEYKQFISFQKNI